ncbi:LysR family transcriptional regulator [Agrobacterium rubi]|uniref:LysR family transcriptional regulator n=2 Tax=Agrobacterium rubi TaxID=28099 RepID=A0AAE7R713_9HYPH|nr:LysR family transcriptional regulator [Agrobacterium rubi]NTE87865.1 LysR family transcriptional regulator [Agrobacterium rubi]NTF05137.1 LysR family transcriptional regulator [Agrobacterium rubi]NTF37958.1 LysR family transcriptional regulator [Agrobacterium rubi]OCJ54209.1 LysR family transcriptional regulator [Agrobacterium rubi]QTG03125.1 LysR family transcriptional regulator [Agrobacterium rubi]
MDHYGIELKPLAKFVLACQNPSLSASSQALGVAPSVLSTALHGLEDRLHMKLFERKGRYLGLLPSAFWLYRNAVSLLHLEEFARRSLAISESRIEKLSVRIDLSFSIGRMSKAVSRTFQQMGALYPQTFLSCQFMDIASTASGGFVPEAMDHIAPENCATITIGCQSEQSSQHASSDKVLFRDPWIAVSATNPLKDIKTDTDILAVVRMSAHDMKIIAHYAKKHGMSARLKFVDAEPSDLGRLLSDFPHMRFLLPASMVANRLGINSISREPLEPPLVSAVLAKTVSGPLEAKIRCFIALLRDNVDAEERNVVFEPELTARQMHYFNLVHRSGSISAAARVANLSQSSVSAQLHGMERVLNERLFERGKNGATPTPAGASLWPLMAEAEKRQDLMLRQSRGIAAHTQHRVSIGMLPSSGHDSALTEKIAEALTSISIQHPSLKMEIIEASNTVLHDKVRHGELNLAIVGVVQPQFPRILLGASEPLSVVANPRFDFGARSEIDLADVCELPLVLGARHLSIHQTFAAAARARNLVPHPKIEVGSLALAIALVRRASLCTILPASSVQKDLETGRLIAVKINQAQISGTLSIIFSADRELSGAERTVMKTLADVFGKTSFDMAYSE